MYNNIRKRKEIVNVIEELIEGLVNIKDSGEYTFVNKEKESTSDKDWKSWNWAQGVALYGLYKYGKAEKSERAYKEIENWYRDLLNDDLREKNINFMAPILALANLYEENRDESILPHLKIWANWAMNELPKTKFHGFQHTVFSTSNTEQLWDDTLMMSVLALAKIGVLLDDQRLISEAERQFLVHTLFLLDRKTGLWFHGWTFEGNHNYSEALWGRGNCWITIAIPELIEILGEKISLSAKLLLTDVLYAQIESLIEYQSVEGTWHTLIDDPTSYIEISGTLGFAYGILKASHLGLIDSKKYKEVGKKAIEGSLAYIRDGKVGNVSAGTGVKKNLESYKTISITDMPYGPALAILALSEYLVEFDVDDN